MIKNHGLGSWDVGGGHNRLSATYCHGAVGERKQLIYTKKVHTWQGRPVVREGRKLVGTVKGKCLEDQCPVSSCPNIYHASVPTESNKMDMNRRPPPNGLCEIFPNFNWNYFLRSQAVKWKQPSSPRNIVIHAVKTLCANIFA